jgi:heme-degrading monooxygenase HmoA
MIAVIFEVVLKDAYQQEYLAIASALRPVLESMPGFISIERFESLSNPGKMLSLSFWESEDAVAAWRNTEVHRMAQAKGRETIFLDYRLRVAGVIRDYGMTARNEAPQDSRARHGAGDADGSGGMSGK